MLESLKSLQKPVTLHSLGDALAAVLVLPQDTAPVPVLVICHGAGEFKENYVELGEFLAGRGMASLLLDMHGHGQSEGARHQVEMRQWVADIRAALDFLEREPRVDAQQVGAFGLSSGGTAILEAALVEPRLKALIALSATVRNSLPWSESLALKLLVALGHLKRLITKKDLRLNLLKMMGELHLASDPEINHRLLTSPGKLTAYKSYPLPGAAQSFFVDTLKRVPRIKIPTLVIWGEDDQLDPVATARMLFAALTCKKQLQIIAGNGHVGHLDRHRETVFELTADWLRENLV